jgi:glycosyltransferase involved in cell wall biosynthesis
LTDVIAVTDLFVNPPRQGGGGGALRALAVGVPVVTYPDCDVSNITGKDFCCHDMSEMQEQMQRYMEDKSFYIAQQQKAREVYQEREKDADSVMDEVQKMLQQVDEWLQRGELQ